MTIEYLEFREGEQLSDPINAEKQTYQLVLERWKEHKTLPAGEHDLTPDVWVKHGSNLFRYSLIVNENGTASYRMIPKDEDVGSFMAQYPARFKPGGRIINMPDDASFAVVAGPQRGDPTLRVYGIVFYHPGPSPKR